MNEVDRIRKRLAETNAGEQGWRKVLATAEGSFSRALAEKNLSRLASLREQWLNELDKANSNSAAGNESAGTLLKIIDDSNESVTVCSPNHTEREPPLCAPLSSIRLSRKN